MPKPNLPNCKRCKWKRDRVSPSLKTMATMHSRPSDAIEEELLTLEEIHWGFKANPKRFLINPTSPVKQTWDVIVILLVLFNAVALPYELGFQHKPSDAYRIVNILVDVIFGLDIIINFLTTYKDPESHFFVNNYKIVALKYLYSWFIVDFIAVFPFDAFGGGGGSSNSAFLGMLKNIRLLRMSKIFVYIRNIHTSEISNLLRLGWMVILFCMVIHWTACLFAGAALYADTNNTWIHHYEAKKGVISSRYVAAIYWSSMSVTTVGYGDIVAQNDFERMVNSFTMVIGALIYAVIFGNISLYIANINRDETNYQEAVGTLVAHMRDISLPQKLQSKVLSYHDYVWQKNRGQSDDNHLRDVPKRVQVEVAVLVHGRMIKSNAAFADAPDSFINAASLALRFTVCLPNQYVYQQGEVADSLFFIGRGQVGVFRQTYGSMSVLGAGSYFGEIPIMLKSAQSMNYSSSFRLHSVRGYAYCDLWKMDYDSWNDLLNSHPSFKALIGNIAMERMKQQTFYDDELMVHKVGMKFIREKQKRERFMSRNKSHDFQDDGLNSGLLSNGSLLYSEDDNHIDENANTHMLQKLEKHMLSITQKVDQIDMRASTIDDEIINIKDRTSMKSEDDTLNKSLLDRETVASMKTPPIHEIDDIIAEKFSDSK